MRAAALPRTLRARLVAAAGGSILAAVLLFGVATVLLVRHDLRSSLDSALRGRAEEVTQLAVSAPAVLGAPGSLESPVSGRQLAVEVLDAHGRLLARSLTLGARLLPQDQLTVRARVRGRPGFEDVRIADRPFRVYAAPIPDLGGPAAGGVVLVASDTGDISHTLGHLGLLLTLSGLGAAVVAVLAAALLTRRGLRPLRELAAAAGEIERTGDSARRLPEDVTADEIGQLTGVLNRMLASLERTRAGERRFLADASHELRTPVAALLGNVEFVGRHGPRPDVLADLQRDAQRLARLVDDLLVLERARSAGEEPRPVELRGLVEDALRTRGVAPERVALLAREPVTVAGERQALERVVANLIDNALVHGPAGGHVSVTLRHRDGHALLSVADEGPGPDPAYGQRLFERFWRPPDAAERPGSGLGLAIAAAIVERHGGRIDVRGSEFTVELPLPRADSL